MRLSRTGIDDRVAWLLALLCTGFLVGCDEREVQKWFSQSSPPVAASPADRLFEGPPLKEALAALQATSKTPVQALSLLVYGDHIVLQAQDVTRPDHVDQFVYRNGAVGARIPVKLMGKGKLDDNLFPLQAARLEAIPELVRAAKQRVNIPEGKVTRVLLKRNLPESMDIQFRVFVTSQRRDGYMDADKDGNILEVKP